MNSDAPLPSVNGDTHVVTESQDDLNPYLKVTRTLCTEYCGCGFLRQGKVRENGPNFAGRFLSKPSVPAPASGKQLQISEPGVCRAEREKTQL